MHPTSCTAFPSRLVSWRRCDDGASSPWHTGGGGGGGGDDAPIYTSLLFVLEGMICDGASGVWIVGGTDGNTFFEDVWCFDLDEMAWLQIEPSGDGPSGR